MSLSNRKIIVTGGPTREWIDPVRYISNASSGKMGIAIADAAAARSTDTVFIHGPVSENLLKDKKFRKVSVESTYDLLEAAINEIIPECVIIMAAAPADYRPAKKSATKIKKENETDELVLTFKKNPDILKTIAEKKSRDNTLSSVFVVGFAAETDNMESNALKKLNAKNLDMICLNDVTQKDAGFAADTNRLTIFTKDNGKIKRTELPLLSKTEAANKILDLIELKLK